MTIAQDLRTRARHRGLTPWQLVQKIGRLEREADERTCQLVAMATDIDGLKAERNELEAQLDAAGIELSGARLDLEAAERELVELRAFRDNALAVTVPPMERDTSDGADQATQPIDVREIQARFATGPVVTLNHSPQADSAA